MVKFIGLVMMCALACGVLACSDDEGTTESDLSASMCEKSKECDPDGYALAGGDESCADLMEELAYGAFFCADYDSTKAAECEDALADQGCDDYNTAQPSICDEVCGEPVE